MNLPANNRLDEDVLKTSFAFVFRRRLHQDEYIRLTHTSSKDVLIKTNVLVLVIRLQDVFKTNHQVKLFLLTRFQDVFEIYSKRF